jgi:hypothetical protein
MEKDCCICKVACGLVVIGALNWGLVGAFNLDLVEKLLGDMTVASRVVYVLVGLAGILKLVACFKKCPACVSKPAA